MQQGSFYCFVPRKSTVPGWLPFSKAAQKVLRKRFDALLTRDREPSPGPDGPPAVDAADRLDAPAPGWQDDRSPLEHAGATGDLSSAHPLDLSLDRHGSGCLFVRFGCAGLAGSPCCIQPHVYRDDRAVVVFYGHLSNVDDLLLHIGLGGRKTALAGAGWGGDEAEMVRRNIDEGTLAARVLLSMFLDHRDRDPLWVLSELQGHYAFVIYDTATKQAFAARGPSGRQQLFYHSDPDQGVSFADRPIAIDGTHAESEWVKVPPGHFVAGKTPKLQQFALTPEQLQAVKTREFEEPPIDEDWWLSSGSPGHNRRSSLGWPFHRRKSGQLEDLWTPGSI
ncbi:unnamed protein product [Ostreobium quekettii]|uniref:DUF3700 domain-containing protein n=1 Tax=Ostreobium quekettii TaxID=121088 RepID=A0A8S1IWL0_9CHLO|nr:unnamed protein product [Ostreobium quekettii]|eukprot:evm.model.scf_87.9 EVM.evm.TU.scf_87.9   scf_87:134231-136795(-)